MCHKKIEKKIVTKILIILPEFGRKLAENWLIFGPKKPAGLSGFEDRASGGPGLAKIGRAGGLYRPGPWPVTSLLSNNAFHFIRYDFPSSCTKEHQHVKEI